jgi:hypothetical protein
MAKILVCTAAFVLAISEVVFSQDDSTRYINGLPVTEDDTVRQFPQDDLEPKTVLMPMQNTDLPPRLLRVLETEAQYRGWQDSIIYLEKNTGLYQIPVKYPGGVKIFGLNKNGDPVTFRDVGKRGTKQ